MIGQARILLLCDDRRSHANTILEHIEAFRRFSHHQVKTFNPMTMGRSLALDLGEFDVVVVHYSVVLSYPRHMSPHLLDKLRAFQGLKIQFIQDDYRWVDRATAAARDVGITVLFTLAHEPAASQLYDERLPGVRRVYTLTGYVPDSLRDRPVRPLGNRTVDVGYRARDLPFWLGRLSREKAWIGQRFAALAPQYNLRCDITLNEQDRIYGLQWIEFLSSCRATLGTESGASIADFDGSAERAVRGYLRKHPGAPYEEVHDAVLRPYEGNVFLNVISPRVFEAASLGTALIMFPGSYSGVVSPGEHYILLEKDLSNMKDVVEQLRDDSLVAAMTSRTHADLIKSGRWSLASFIAEFDRVVTEEAKVTRGGSSTPRLRFALVERAVRVPGLRVRLLRGALGALKVVRGRHPTGGFAVEDESQVVKGLLALRLVLQERDLRQLYRLGRKVGAPLDRLLREILEVSLLRRAAVGELGPEQDFSLSTEFDSGRKAVCFVSTPNGERGPQPGSPPDPIQDLLRVGELKAIEWDHRALGGSVSLGRPPMEIGIGFGGLENFTILADIGRRDPLALERVLAPVLAAIERVPSAVE
jgi:hypothetical protein